MNACRGLRGRLVLLATMALGALGLVAGAAQANTVTVGSVLPPGFSSEPVGEVQTFLNTALPEKGASLASPATGAIVRWRLQGAKGGPFRLRVLRPNGLGAYTAVGTSDPVTVADAGLQTFTANLPIRAGDLLAIDPSNASDELGFAIAAGAAYTTIFPNPFEGATVPGREPKTGSELELSAEVQPTPTVTEVSPRSGSVSGGTEVTIQGADLTGASAVKFGDVPAASFKVEDDGEIVASAPKSTRLGTFDVTVTTLAGTSATVGADHFTYTGCAVPKLKGLKLGRVKQLLRGASCKLGKVTTKHGVSKKKGKVINQSPKPRRVFPRGHKVNVRLG